MSWIQYTFEIQGRPASALLDTQFKDGAPTPELTNFAWFGVYCRLSPGGGLWDPKEQRKLDAIERDLIRLCGKFGNCWAVYVRRLDTPGIREYYVYFGDDAELEKVLPVLKSRHAGYRIEFETYSDPRWSHYQSWLEESGFER
jgi:hypothetical protein